MNERTCRFPPPARVWEQTPEGLWTSRQWKFGEKKEYAQKVLGQRLEDDESSR